jgi:predicted DNA-binding transcriptional regulator YafY
MRRKLEDDSLYVGRRKKDVQTFDLRLIRLAMRDQRKMRIAYTDQGGVTSKRIIWPIILGFVESRRFVAGWCELRKDFRLFRADRIAKAEFLNDHYQRNRRELVKEWRKREDLGRTSND